MESTQKSVLSEPTIKLTKLMKRNNMGLLRIRTILILTIGFLNIQALSAQSDSFNIQFLYYKCKKFKIYINDTLIAKVNCRPFKRDTIIHISSMQAFQSEFNNVDISVYKKGLFGWQDTKVTVISELRMPYLIFHQDFRVKRRFCITNFWCSTSI